MRQVVSRPSMLSTRSSPSLRSGSFLEQVGAITTAFSSSGSSQRPATDVGLNQVLSVVGTDQSDVVALVAVGRPERAARCGAQLSTPTTPGTSRASFSQ